MTACCCLYLQCRCFSVNREHALASALVRFRLAGWGSVLTVQLHIGLCLSSTCNQQQQQICAWRRERALRDWVILNLWLWYIHFLGKILCIGQPSTRTEYKNCVRNEYRTTYGETKTVANRVCRVCEDSYSAFKTIYYWESRCDCSSDFWRCGF